MLPVFVSVADELTKLISSMDALVICTGDVATVVAAASAYWVAAGLLAIVARAAVRDWGEAAGDGLLAAGEGEGEGDGLAAAAGEAAGDGLAAPAGEAAGEGEVTGEAAGEAGEAGGGALVGGVPMGVGAQPAPTVSTSAAPRMRRMARRTAVSLPRTPLIFCSARPQPLDQRPEEQTNEQTDPDFQQRGRRRGSLEAEHGDAEQAGRHGRGQPNARHCATRDNGPPPATLQARRHGMQTLVSRPT